MLKKLLRNWLEECPHPQSMVVYEANDRLSETPETTNMVIFNAIGGKVVEFRRYDHRKDEHYIARYIIKDDDDDFGSRLSNIITLENLKY